MKVLIGRYRNFNKKTQTQPERNVQVRIDKYDTWSMDHTLAYIIHPMLVQLKATKHGAPFTSDDDVPEHLRSTSPPVNEENNPKGDYEGASSETNLFAKWDWILDEMIWAFAEELNEDAESQFYTGEADHRWVPLDKDRNPLGPPTTIEDKAKPPAGTKSWQLEKGPNHTLVHDEEAHRAYDKRKQNGFRLFGTYYQNLWD